MNDFKNQVVETLLDSILLHGRATTSSQAGERVYDCLSEAGLLNTTLAPSELKAAVVKAITSDVHENGRVPFGNKSAEHAYYVLSAAGLLKG